MVTTLKKTPASTKSTVSKTDKKTVAKTPAVKTLAKKAPVAKTASLATKAVKTPAAKKPVAKKYLAEPKGTTKVAAAKVEKKAVAKATAVKTVAKKVAAPKAEKTVIKAVKKTDVKKSSPTKAETVFSDKQIHQMIATAAYFLAEHRGFAKGHDVQDWVLAEAEIYSMLNA